MSPEDRHELLDAAVPELRVQLAFALSALGEPSTCPPSRPVTKSDDLPADLAEKLSLFQARIETRYKRLLKSGHERTGPYVAEVMAGPKRLASFLAAEGITRWDAMRKRDLVAFFAANPRLLKAKVERFMKFLNEHKPFRETRGGAAKPRGMKRPRSAPVVMPPEELRAALSEIRLSATDQEYLLAWLICRMGMTATSAYSLTLDRVTLNDQGQLVIRPARAWVVVPVREAAIFKAMAEAIAPAWPKMPEDALKFITIFDAYIPNLNRYAERVLKGRARLLRSSAIFAAMMTGHLDRVTLNKTMGVSTPTIAKLETLLSGDLHRRLDPDFIKERNKRILGEGSDE